MLPSMPAADVRLHMHIMHLRSSVMDTDDRRGDDEPQDEGIPRSLASDGGPRRPGHLPVRLWRLLMLMTTFASMQKPLFVVDAFSGRGAISYEFRRRGHAFSRLDIDLDERDETWSKGVARVGAPEASHRSGVLTCGAVRIFFRISAFSATYGRWPTCRKGDYSAWALFAHLGA